MKPPPSDDSDDDIPLLKSGKTKKQAVKKEGRSNGDQPSKPKPAKRPKPESDGEDDIPRPKSRRKTSKVVDPPSKRPPVKSEDGEVKPEDEDGGEYRWWESSQNDGTVKWTTLEHNGVLFPPPYELLPKHVKMKYDRKEVSLPPEAEEVAGFFAALLESDHARNPVFQKNFFNDWLDVLKKCNAVARFCPPDSS